MPTRAKLPRYRRNKPPRPQLVFGRKVQDEMSGFWTYEGRTVRQYGIRRQVDSSSIEVDDFDSPSRGQRGPQIGPDPAVGMFYDK